MGLFFFFRRTHEPKKVRIHFFGIYESPKDANSIFLQAKDTQTCTDSKRHSHFLQTQTVHKSDPEMRFLFRPQQKPQPHPQTQPQHKNRNSKTATY